ncbi:FATC domain protein, partial [Oesophagostomum dentatum]
ERFGAYLKTYRERFSEPLVKAHQLLDAESLDLNACLRYFAVVQNNICDIYLGLLSLNESTQTAHLQSPSALSPNSTKSDTPELPPGFEDTRPHHQQQQEQNAHANSVVRRVRARLEGRIEAADHQKIITPNEQVDILISQATNANLLSLMYEGWTAWNILVALRDECVTAAAAVIVASRHRRENDFVVRRGSVPSRKPSSTTWTLASCTIPVHKPPFGQLCRKSALPILLVG